MIRCSPCHLYAAFMTDLLACERVWLGCRNTATQRLFSHAPTIFAIAQLLDLEAAGAVVFCDLDRELEASVHLTGRIVWNPLLAGALQKIQELFDDDATSTRLMWALNAITPHAMSDAMPYLEKRGLAIREQRLLWFTRWKPHPMQRLNVLQEARLDVLRGEFSNQAARNFLIAVSAGNYESRVLGQSGRTNSDLTERLASMLSGDAVAMVFESIVALTTHAPLTVRSH